MLRKIFIVILLGAFGIGLATESEQPVREKALFNCRLKNGDSMPLKAVVQGMIRLRRILKEDTYDWVRDEKGRINSLNCCCLEQVGTRKLHFLANENLFDNTLWTEKRSDEELLEELRRDGFIDENGRVKKEIKSLATSSLVGWYPAGIGCGANVYLGNPIDFKNTVKKDFWGL